MCVNIYHKPTKNLLTWRLAALLKSLFKKEMVSSLSWERYGFIDFRQILFRCWPDGMRPSKRLYSCCRDSVDVEGVLIPCWPNRAFIRRVRSRRTENQLPILRDRGCVSICVISCDRDQAVGLFIFRWRRVRKLDFRFSWCWTFVRSGCRCRPTQLRSFHRWGHWLRMCYFEVVCMSNFEPLGSVLVGSDFYFESGSGGPTMHPERPHIRCLEASSLVLPCEDVSDLSR